MRRILRLVALVLAAGGMLGFTAAAASAGGNGAQTYTQTDHNVTDTHPDVNPCTGDTGMLTETYNDIFHITVNKTGSWVTGTVEGKFTFVPDNPAAVTYTGHFATWFGDENNLQNDVEHSTANIHAAGSDGSRLSFHENVQVTLNANGVVTVSFDKLRCG
jgi:hypothetical protein